MEKIQTLLVDDEFLALKLLEDYLSKLPEFRIVEKFRSPLKAVELINSRKIDLLFLDIQMPTLSGTNLLKTLTYQPVTIFTTAYSEYAAEAFDLNAADYLVKPFSFERFLQAVNKAKGQLEKKSVTKTISSTEKYSHQNFLSVKSEGKFVKIPLNEIVYIEGLREYVKIICTSGHFITLESLKNLENTLPTGRFLRVHKSYIVAIDKVRALSGNMLETGNTEIPLSREKKDEIIAKIFR